MCLNRLLAIAKEHKTCDTEQPRIEGDRIILPIDCHHPQRGWSIERVVIRNRRQLLEALGY